MGNGKEEQYKVIRDLIGGVRFNWQEEWSQVKLTDVTLLPNAKFNLFSLTQLIKKDGC